jgi:hypothetical protein
LGARTAVRGATLDQQGTTPKAKVVNIKSYRWKQVGNAASQWDFMSCCPLLFSPGASMHSLVGPTSTVPLVFIGKQGPLTSVCTSDQMKI